MCVLSLIIIKLHLKETNKSLRPSYSFLIFKRKNSLYRCWEIQFFFEQCSLFLSNFSSEFYAPNFSCLTKTHWTTNNGPFNPRPVQKFGTKSQVKRAKWIISNSLRGLVSQYVWVVCVCGGWGDGLL
jgi:hypothetical protein